MQRQRVVIFGSSGTMGIKAFEELWKRKKDYDISILVRPSKKNKKMFRPYEKKMEIKPIPQAGTVHRNGTRYWYEHKNDNRIIAFFRDYQTYEFIPDWDTDKVSKSDKYRS